jgi:hypothetical protein
MPIDYRKYPANWFTEIRPRILERENHCCQKCGVQNGLLGWRVPGGPFYTVNQFKSSHIPSTDVTALAKVMKKKPKPYKIVLTVAHLDHLLIDHEDSNLAALCQRCHLNHDRQAVVLRRRQGRRYSRKKCQLLLFPLPEQPTLVPA